MARLAMPKHVFKNLDRVFFFNLPFFFLTKACSNGGHETGYVRKTFVLCSQSGTRSRLLMQSRPNWKPIATCIRGFFRAFHRLHEFCSAFLGVVISSMIKMILTLWKSLQNCQRKVPSKLSRWLRLYWTILTIRDFRSLFLTLHELKNISFVLLSYRKIPKKKKPWRSLSGKPANFRGGLMYRKKGHLRCKNVWVK